MKTFLATLFAVAVVSLTFAQGDQYGNGIFWSGTGPNGTLSIPTTGTTNQTMWVTTWVTNTGSTTWDGNYFILVWDEQSQGVTYASIAGLAPNQSTFVTLSIQLPQSAQTKTYYFQAAYLGQPIDSFGPIYQGTVTVQTAPVTVDLSIDNPTIVQGQSTTLRSTAGAAGAVASHGLQWKIQTGDDNSYQNWGTVVTGNSGWSGWNDSGGTQQSLLVTPAMNQYTLRAYATPQDGTPIVYSTPVNFNVQYSYNGVGWNAPPTDMLSDYNLGSTITFNVTVTNTGTETWAYSANSSTNYCVEVIYNSTVVYTANITATITPGNSVTVPVVLTLQPSAGNYSYGFQMLQENVGTFGGVQTQNVVDDTPPTTQPLNWSVSN